MEAITINMVTERATDAEEADITKIGVETMAAVAILEDTNLMIIEEKKILNTEILMILKSLKSVPTEQLSIMLTFEEVRML